MKNGSSGAILLVVMNLFGPLLQRFLHIIPYIVVFISSLYHPYDPDLGWHLKYGEYFFKNRAILRENIFSTDMANFQWANSSWVTDLISYVTFNSFGFLGLAVLAAAVITLTFYFFARGAKLDYFEKALIFPLLLYFLAPLNSVSFKGQLLSLLFTGILVFLFKEYEEKKSKLIFLTIPLFILWSNIHGQFILGLGIFGLLIILHLIKLILAKNKKDDIVNQGRTLSGVVILTAFAAAINPFGINVYLEASHHFGNPWQKYIAEWLPQEELSLDWWRQLAAGLLLFFGALFIILNGQLFGKLTSFVVWPFFALSFLVRRYLWTTYYLAIPLMQPMITFFKPESRGWQMISGTVIVLTFLMLSIFIDNPFDRVANMSWQSYCQKFQGCSDGAVKFIVEQKLNNNLLTFYNWGGWLIWRWPEVKPSIDGRMHLWKNENGYSAFAYYYPFEQDQADIDSSKYNVVLMTPEKPMYDRLVELVDEGEWRLAYKDDYAGVFVRKPL